VLAGLIGLELSDEGPADAGQVARAIADEAPDAAGSETLRAIFADVAPGGAVVLLLVEHLWALPLAVAVRDAGGVLSGQQMITEATLRRIPGVLAAAAQDGRS
jgi:hypothetical protein